ncbi:MAG TPA: P63C domain-containing protein [Blastocatellia bacterium]|nr:P63C domain-containing protein [Blastocatellia bacterium]
MKENGSKKSIGGVARAQKLTPERRREIAQIAAQARWEPDDDTPYAIREGLLPIGEVELECSVLKDRRRIFHKRGLARALGMKSRGGNIFMRTMNRKGLGSVIPEKLRDTLDNPIIFKTLKGDPAHGYEGKVLIEICDAIWEAKKQNALSATQEDLAKQAEIILRSAAKVGIIALIDEAAGFTKDKLREEYKELFKEFIRNECREWEKEFPDQLFDVIYSIYKLPRTSKNKHPQFFGHFIRKYIYAPLANSNGAILEMLDEKNPVVYVCGGRRYKMFQFLTETIGLAALRAHIWQIVGIGSATRSKESFDRGFKKAFPQSGTQGDLFDDLYDLD